MAKYCVPYGAAEVCWTMAAPLRVDVVSPKDVPAADNPVKVVEEALADPLGLQWNSFAGVRRVSIAVNDKTRPVPHDILLPPLLARLEQMGLPPQAITLYIANGTHAPMTPDEYPSVLPAAVLERYRVVSHDGDRLEEMVLLGETRRGTPIWVNRAFYESDLRVVVGNIEPHQFAGFSGGVKTAVIGLGARLAIDKNHSLMLDPASEMGRYRGNPAREDMEEAGARIGVHVALNAILNIHGEVVKALAGDPVAVMEAGVAVSQEICMVPVPHAYDLVISSPGGHPKDINLYQAQ
ncbi:MAG: nickel-dependent lactate racemase, partial [Chloroflexi bacterium]|nr:nickel-dependent lactate racemase [Chloroflexota bacterium]